MYLHAAAQRKIIENATQLDEIIQQRWNIVAALN